MTTTETTALSTIDDIQLPANKYASDEDFKSVISATSYLPRLQLYGSSSGLVKEGKINMGRYGLVRSKDSVVELGATINCIVLGYRLKAMQIAEEGIISKYNSGDPEFKRIVATADADSESGCMYGAEFLLYVPDLKEYVTYYMSTKSSRREAPVLKGLLKKQATLGVKLIKTKKYTWHAPTVTICSSPLEYPSNESIIEEATKFANPSESEVESTTETEAAATTRER